MSSDKEMLGILFTKKTKQWVAMIGYPIYEYPGYQLFAECKGKDRRKTTAQICVMQNFWYPHKQTSLH